MASAADGRAQYLQRPDLGRRLADGTELEAGEWDLVVVVADGLSASGGARPTRSALVSTLVPQLEGWRVAPVVVADPGAGGARRRRRAAARARRWCWCSSGSGRACPRPTRLGAYLTWAPRRGRADSERNCVSNIRPPDGLSYERATEVLVALMTEARRLELTGVGLKDTGGALPPGE